MTRITPRTCLWPLAGTLCLTFALSIGLTFRSNLYCYAGTCGEALFPLQARLHVVVWYGWLSSSVTFLAVRAFHPSLRKLLRIPLLERKLPIIGKQLTISGALLLFWIGSLYGIILGIWWIRLHDYFSDRGIKGGVLSGNDRLAAIAVTGHLCDVTMGMALVPISRHSALASFFKISVATTLAFHMLTAYVLFMLVLAHGLLYVSWVTIFQALSEGMRTIFPVLNPTYLYQETWPGDRSSLGIWRASLIFTGTVAALIMLLIFFTTLPFIRSKHFNIFYFTHLLSIVVVIVICLHASTMLYCTAPGLMMWVLDWSMRLYELRASLAGTINGLGGGWYSLSVPLPRHRLDGCACTSPLAHFYIHHSDSSIRELHPFTTTTHLASQNTVTHHAKDDINIQFLFRKQGTSVSLIAPPTTPLGFGPSIINLLRRIHRHKASPQWTNRLADLADQQNWESSTMTTLSSVPGSPELCTGGETVQPNYSVRTGLPIAVRLEGPYFTPADPARYNTVVCFVAGTGVSGALAIVGAFQELERQAAAMNGRSLQHGQEDFLNQAHEQRLPQDHRAGSIVTLTKERIWLRCVVVWSVREADFLELPQLQVNQKSGLEVCIHLTGNGRERLKIGDTLDEIMNNSGSGTTVASTGPSTWVYISGPNAFIAAVESECKARQQKGVDWYGAKWEI